MTSVKKILNMNKNNIRNRNIFAMIIAVSLSLSLSPGIAQEEPFVEGEHYQLLDEVQPVQTGDRIEVAELFWYHCPHCFLLEPFIAEWRKNIPDGAEYVPIPALLNDRWEFDARVYYTFEALGLLEDLHGKYFSAIHEQRLNIRTAEQLAAWATDNGVDGDGSKIPGAFTSFAVQNKLNFSRVMSRRYGINGVPAIIVDGRYRTSVSLSGSHAKLIKVINFLIGKAAQQKNDPSSSG